MIVDLFWVQVEHDFILKLRWVTSKSNAEADAWSRPGSDDYVRLDATVFGSLYTWAGGFDMDLMATPACVHQKWVAGRKTQENIPFYSRYRTPGCAGVDVLTQNVKFMPESSVEWFGFCFPPTNMVGAMLQHLAECQARAVILVPDQKQSWFPRLARGLGKVSNAFQPGEKITVLSCASPAR